MKCRAFVTMTTVAIALTGAAIANVEAGTPAQERAASAEKTKAGETGGGAKKITMKNFPAAVKATVEAESKDATVKGLSSEKENGKTVYELETLVNGRTRDLMIDATGKVYLVEEQLDVDKAPAPVRAALEKRGRIVRLESVMQNGTTVYEGQVQPTKGRKVTIELHADGTPVRK